MLLKYDYRMLRNRWGSRAVLKMIVPSLERRVEGLFRSSFDYNIIAIIIVIRYRPNRYPTVKLSLETSDLDLSVSPTLKRYKYYYDFGQL